MEELMMKLKWSRNNHSHHHHSSASYYSFTSIEDFDESTTSLSEDSEIWSPQQPPVQNVIANDPWKPPQILQPKVQAGELSEVELITQRFSRLLLGEDMTGYGRGVSTALAISNAITNLYASTFGQLERLEPLPAEKKELWKREMDWLLSVGDYIVEMVPSFKTFPDGASLEIMTCKQRSDLSIDLPALRKLDGMLLEILEGFRDAEFWYVNQIQTDEDTNGSAFFEKTSKRKNKKLSLPIPRIPDEGLSIESKTQLHRKRECATQILKAAMTINTDTISRMDVPESYIESLPKTGKACLGDQFYKFITSENFSVEKVLLCLDLPADHIVSEMVNRLETAIYVWHKKSQTKLANAANNHSTSRSSAVEAERRELFSARAEDLLFTLKHQFPHLPHTTLENNKVQCNKDVGKSILESYSGVLKSLANNIIARIDNLLSIKIQGHQPDESKLRSGIMNLSRRTVSEICSRHFTGVSSRYTPGTHSSSKYDIGHFLNKLQRLNSKAST